MVRSPHSNGIIASVMIWLKLRMGVSERVVYFDSRILARVGDSCLRRRSLGSGIGDLRLAFETSSRDLSDFETRLGMCTFSWEIGGWRLEVGGLAFDRLSWVDKSTKKMQPL